MQHQNISIMKFTLRKKETGRKSGRFLYQIINENGGIEYERRSNREYVACTSNCEFFFGRIDLIGKGDHGKMLKFYEQAMNFTDQQVIQRVGNGFTSIRPDAYRALSKIKYEELSNIAHLEK